MLKAIPRKLMQCGLEAARCEMTEEDRIWSRYSNDKVDIGEELAKVIRTLSKEFPLSKPLRALSIGSSNEPQFRLLETAFQGGLYLLDIDKAALNMVKERIRRQFTTHVKTICADFDRIFLDSRKTKKFFREKLGGQKINLATLHHSMYYCDETRWSVFFENLCRCILSNKGAIHAVLMAAETEDLFTTTGLYNHFVGKFLGLGNSQSLCNFKRELEKNRFFSTSQILIRRNRARFFVSDFGKLMSVVWMILLYPDVHKYNLRQREEIVEFVYKKFWRGRKPLIQLQDHLVVYRGIRCRGLI